MPLPSFFSKEPEETKEDDAQGESAVDGIPPDSLTLAQLKALVSHMPKAKVPEYAFEYADTDNIKAELEEWFVYAENQYLLNGAQVFEKTFTGSWLKASSDARKSFVETQLGKFDTDNATERLRAGTCLVYICQGIFKETVSTEHQLHWIFENAKLVRSCGALDTMWGSLLHSCKVYDEREEGTTAVDIEVTRAELTNALTVLYFLTEIFRTDNGFRSQMSSLSPNPVSFLITELGKFRYRNPENCPIRQLLSFFWKVILTVFGGRKDLAKTKIWARKRMGLPEEMDHSTIVASPLDYNAFRQEIIAKFPAYEPPEPLLRLDPDATSLFPASLAIHAEPEEVSPITAAVNAATNPHPNAQNPLLATPAPSPPPSPRPSPKLPRSIFQTPANMPFQYPAGLGLEESVPESVREASEIYASRTRTALGVWQMWREKEEFERRERGWVYDDDDTDEVESDNEEERRLRRIEEVYNSTLPELQSFVVVLLKVLLATTNIDSSDDDTKSSPILISLSSDSKHLSETDIDERRTREIMAKTISATLLLLLKWFRVSHVFKFEYLAQLLVDSNSLLLLVKIFANDLSTAVAEKTEIKEQNFFRFCNLHSAQPQPPERTQGTTAGAALKKAAGAVGATSNWEMPDDGRQDHDTQPPVQIGEYSWRVFLATINYLKIMSKMVKRKAARNLLMVQYKASANLRKLLKIPHEELRVCTLKVMKCQVPFYGRKWRQSNMRIITSIYLHCRPELRDDWVAALDVDEQVETAQPQEQALRALVQFHHLRRYPVQMENMGFEGLRVEGERDFFGEELVRMGIDLEMEKMRLRGEMIEVEGREPNAE
ncbi:N1221-domain-containing protein [Saitoella complicata NRRL Y-17804]|nr:N1221-domain-containing protein [Saitoella complicata NRRL Y-17804]ODQ51919.1 N1221-domain-containing protein [Saitoella complicata NRRL Y-17804]